MHGPPLTRPEIAAVLRAEVRRLVARKVDCSVAITAVAEEHDIAPERVAELVDSAETLLGSDA